MADLSIQRGFGLFDFFRLQGLNPLFLDDHLHRFYRSAGGLGLQLPLNDGMLRQVIRELISCNQMPGSGVKMLLTGGASADGISRGEPCLVITQHPIKPVDEETRTRGISLKTFSHQRTLPHIKSIDYLMALWLQPQLAAKGYDEALYVQGGFVRECPRCNIFMIDDSGRLITPKNNLLEGITRKHVLLLAGKVMPVSERDIMLEELLSAREVFISSTTKEIMPVRRIDDTHLSTFDQTLALQEIFRKYCAEQSS